MPTSRAADTSSPSSEPCDPALLHWLTGQPIKWSDVLPREDTPNPFALAASLPRTDRLILDDPYVLGAPDCDVVVGWWKDALASRLNDPDAPVVIIIARLHEADLPGIVDLDVSGYDYLTLPPELA